MIRIQNLTKDYGANRAVDDLSVEINGGEIIGLLGPNGAGKTTTMRIVTGYLKPTSGTVKVKDLDVNEDPIEVKRLIGYLPESAPLYPDMLTYDYLSYVAAVHGIPGKDVRSRIEELVDVCGLQGVMHKAAKELSRGYKQRVGLAYAMMNDPEILVLDEPTSGLDPNQIVQIRSIIRRMGEKKTVILSTHILSEAEATCDRILIINRGKLVADGTPESLGASGISSYILRMTVKNAGGAEASRILSSVPGVTKVIVPPDVTAQAGELKLQVFCETDLREELYNTIKSTNWVLMEFANERQSLEETFRELTLSESGKAEE
ncbi:MAG: ATP-binding cassette domain-containing protein [Spirochaetales bacterium]|nr:ATP-binding cassette domain-containing protein [Spirochaetales bacterium]